MEHVTTSTSAAKLEIPLPQLDPIAWSDSLLKLFTDTRHAFYDPFDITHIESNIRVIKTIFIDFDREFNHSCIADLDSFNNCIGIRLIGYDIDLHFLSQREDSNYIATICHAVNTFCNLFKADVSGWKIYFRLDDITRTGPSVGGVTKYKKKQIICTKREEIIKLLFHEMIHCIRLNNELMSFDNNYLWNIEGTVNLTEAHTELLAVVIHSAYVSLQLELHIGIRSDTTFLQILNEEYRYSFWLAANILKSYHSSLQSFLTKTSNPYRSTVQVWAYVFARAIGFTNLHKILDTNDPKTIANLLKQNDTFIHNLQLFMDNTNPINSLSYLMIDLDYDKL